MDSFRHKLMQLDNDLIAELPQFEKAIVEIVQDLRRHNAGLSAPERAFGIYLLLGATGQNPLPYALAKHLYDEVPVYIDMKQYAEVDSATRLKQHLIDTASHCKVLILGDVDKAHSTVRTLLAELFHDAHLTDAQGNLVAFTDSIFFMTTLVASHLLTSPEVLLESDQAEPVQTAIYSVFEQSFMAPIDLMFPFFEGGTHA